MWDSILAVNSFFVWPLSFIFLIYTIGRFLLFFEWKLFVIGVICFTLTTVAEMVLGVLTE